TGIALQTASALLALGLGLAGSIPERQPMWALLEKTAAGMLARRALPAIILLPLLLGWLRLIGQQRGLYDTGMGVALLTLTLVGVLCIMLCWVISAISTHERALRNSEELFRSMFDVTSVGMAQADPVTGRMLRVNQTLAAMIGRTPEA